MGAKGALLVVSGDVGVAELTTGYLEPLFGRVVLVSTAAELLRAGGKFSLAVVDDSAIELLPRLTEQVGPATALLLLQGEESEVEIERRARKVEVVLAKPFSRLGLVAAALSALAQASRRAEGAVRRPLSNLMEQLSQPLTVQVLLLEHLMELVRERGADEEVVALIEQLRQATRELSGLIERVFSQGENLAPYFSPLLFPEDKRRARPLLSTGEGRQ